jgi:hypothetical protein
LLTGADRLKGILELFCRVVPKAVKRPLIGATLIGGGPLFGPRDGDH